MTENSTNSLAERIDDSCKTFEREWQRGDRPRIEDYAGSWSESERATLVRELLLIELQYRRTVGEHPTPSDYADRFSDEIVESVFERLDSEIETVQLRTIAASRTTHTDVRTAAEHGALNATGDSIGDYELLEEIARGGMGVVYKARQISLNRIVALKMIKAGELAGGEEVQRFISEAESAAKLDHPNIVPIFEVGEVEGRHFFSMGLVEGVSLNDRLKDGPLPPREAAELILTIAAAVQYAHEKGIVHRDLKPANVLIDSDGKPRITDFGLAKNISADSGLTATGQVVGTPSYMPPEQASGNTVAIGPSSDVYSLGAMLYSLIVGRPPFQAANVLETLKQVCGQEPVSPRTLNPTVDKDLETICLKCLEKDAGRRYASAEELAADIERYLQNRPILARPVGRPARAWRWCQRNPLGAAVVVLLIFFAVAGPSVALYQIEMNRRLDDALSGETEQRQKAETKEKEARESERKMGIALKNERAALLEKDKALQETLAAIDRYVQTVKNARLLKEPRFKDLLKLLLKDALAHYQRYVEAHRNDEGEKSRIRLAGSLHEIGYISSNKGSIDVAIRAFQDARKIRRELAENHPDVPQRWLELAETHVALSHLYRSTDERPKALGAAREAMNIGERLIRTHPNVHKYRRTLAATCRITAVLHHGNGDRTDAVTAYRQALKHLDYLTRAQPANDEDIAEAADNHNSLALLYQEIGELPKALTAYRKAQAILENLTGKDSSNQTHWSRLAFIYNHLGILNRTTRQYKKSLGLYKQAIQIRARLTRENPTVTRYQNDLAASRNNLGNLYRDMSRPAEALAAFQSALKIWQTLSRENPKVLEFQSYLGGCYDNLGNLYSDSDKKKAGDAYRQALKIRKELVRKKPTVPVYRRDLATSYSNYGLLCDNNGQRQLAMDQYRLSQELWQKLTRQFPNVVQFRIRKAYCHHNLGTLYKSDGKPRKALLEFDQAIKLAPRFWLSHYHRGKTLREMQRHEMAKQAFDHVIQIQPRQIWAYYYRGLTLEDLGDFARARRDFEYACRRSPANPTFLNELAWLLATCPVETVRDGKRAVQLATKACEQTKWKNGGYCDTLAAAYAESGEFKRATEMQLKALTLLSKSDQTDARSRLALYRLNKPYRQPLPQRPPARAPKPMR